MLAVSVKGLAAVFARIVVSLKSSLRAGSSETMPIGVANNLVFTSDDVTVSEHGIVRPAEGGPDERRKLPAANVSALGRTLFSDHLLAIELAGTLLLVATVGAIAIAGGRREGRA